jgi:tRNA(Ile)-lysidine synthase
MNGCVPTAASAIPRNIEVKRVAVAASGGRDSTALLHCTAKAAAQLGLEVLALHVHHGLNAQADVWLRHVKRQCQRWGVAFNARRLQTGPQAGDSIEAWARRERYAALQEMAQAGGCELVLLAHHRRDQAETFILQALRGGGPAGLSAMPKLSHEAGIVYARPWLDMPREAIEAYVQRHRLAHIEDSSNSDVRLLRNRLRARLWPVLLEAFPDAEIALTGAATRAQEAAALAAEVAALDMPRVLDGAGLDVQRWQVLPQARRLNVLRAWLVHSLGRGSPQALVHRLMLELPAGSDAATAQWDAPGATLRLYRGVLSTAQIAPLVSGGVQRIDLSQPGEVALPTWRGHFVVARVKSGGIAQQLLRHAQVRPRQGGEQFQRNANSDARSLKKQYQARALPAWQRNGPLLFSAQGQLLFVPGLGIDAAALAAADQPQLSVTWCTDR